MRHVPQPLARPSPRFVLAALSAAVLAACGDGGSDTLGSSGGGTAPAAPAALSVSGVAAKGAALDGAAIEARCATGSGSATALADGSYRLEISAGALPCVLKATSQDGATTYHSLASGGGNSATSNITPLTELVIAQMSGQQPAAVFTAADAATLGSVVTAEKIDAASAAVIETLRAAGVDTSAITSIVSGSLAAGTGTGYDGVLDTLGTALAANGSSLDELVMTVAATAAAKSADAPASGSGGETAATSLLPAALLLKPKATHCAALRSTDYHWLVIKPSLGAGGGVTTLGKPRMDVAAADGPTWTFDDGQAVLTPVAGEPCRYSLAGSDGLSGEVVVAPSGIAVARLANTWTGGETQPDPAARMVVAIPVQPIAVAELAGAWNTLGWTAESATTSSVDPVLITVAADGKVSIRCDGSTPATPMSQCTSVDGPWSGFSANADGAFDLTIDAPGELWTERAFAYRAGNGEMSIVMLGNDGTLHFMTRQRTLTLPAVGDSSKSWNLQINPARIASEALSANGYEVTSTNPAAASFTRSVTSPSNSLSFAQTLSLNDARDGWSHRAAGSTTASDGSAVAIREMYSIRLGVGMSAFWLPASNVSGTNARFGLSVNQP
jgi:hypothetical protein